MFNITTLKEHLNQKGYSISRQTLGLRLQTVFKGKIPKIGKSVLITPDQADQFIRYIEFNELYTLKGDKKQITFIKQR